MLKESSLSSRWNTEDMDAYERNNIYIADLGCTMGQAWGALKKSWRQLKYNLGIELATLGLQWVWKTRKSGKIYSSLCTIKFRTKFDNMRRWITQVNSA